MIKLDLSQKERDLVNRIGAEEVAEKMMREGANNFLRSGEDYDGSNKKIIAQAEAKDTKEDISNKDDNESKDSMLGRLGTTIRKLLHNT